MLLIKKIDCIRIYLNNKSFWSGLWIGIYVELWGFFLDEGILEFFGVCCVSCFVLDFEVIYIFGCVFYVIVI